MLKKSFPSAAIHRAWIITLAAVFITYVAVVLRTLARGDIQALLPVYLVLELIYLVLLILMLWHPIAWQPGRYIYFVVQTLLVLYLLLVHPQFDFVAVLFVILAFEAALVFPRRVLAWLVGILILLTFIPLTISQGMYGVALSLMPIAICIVYPAYVLVTQDYEAGLHASQALVDELKIANKQLTAYAAQVEELSIIQEHNRLAHELHDSVSQTIQSILEGNRIARQMLEENPDQLNSQLDQLQCLTQSSLEQMRSLIASLRPSDDRPSEQSTP
jgi:signal transduction histidine kinase